jgi:hypothetical protein
MLMVVLRAVLATAMAQEPAGDQGSEAGRAYPFERAAPVPSRIRTYEIEFGARWRALTVPPAVLDIWWFDVNDPGWAYVDEPRPVVSGSAYGLEMGLRGPHANGIFWVEFVDSAMPEGYWDDVEEPENHLDGRWLSPSAGFGLVAAGGDAFYEAHIVKASRGHAGLSFVMGGGLGVGVVVGRIDQWNADDFGNPAYKRFLDGHPPDETARIPPILPIVDALVGLRLSAGDRWTLRAEGGVHGALAGGLSTTVLL